MTRELALPCGRVGLVDETDLPLLEGFAWRSSVQGKIAYVVATFRGKQFKLANWLMRPPPHLVVDHINGDGLDNRRVNLRVCSQAENSMNRGRHVVRDLPLGVFCCGVSRYRATIRHEGVMHQLGVFDSIEDAAAARLEAAKRLRGPFLRCAADDPMGLSRPMPRAVPELIVASAPKPRPVDIRAARRPPTKSVCRWPSGNPNREMHICCRTAQPGEFAPPSTPTEAAA